MGGADVSLGTIASAMGGLAVLDVNQRIDKYVRENKFDAAVTLRTQYGFGDKVQKGQLWDILSGDALLAEGGVDKADAAAQTKREGDKRVVHITGYHDGMSKEEQFALGITLAHEAYRNGVDDGTLGQRLETNRAVLGHIGFANRMAQTYGIAAIGSVMSAEVEAYHKALNGDATELALKLSSYDSSADYWRLKIDDAGVHWEDDKSDNLDLTAIGMGVVDAKDAEKIAGEIALAIMGSDAAANLTLNQTILSGDVAALGRLGVTARSIKDIVAANNGKGYKTARKNYVEALNNVVSRDLSFIGLPGMPNQEVGYGPMQGNVSLTSRYGYRINTPEMVANGVIGQVFDFGLFHGSRDYASDDPTYIAPQAGRLDLSQAWGGAFGFTTTWTSGAGQLLFDHNSANAIDVISRTVLANEGWNIAGGMAVGQTGTKGGTGYNRTTGTATGPHLNLRYRLDGELVDPQVFYDSHNITLNYNETCYSRYLSGYSDPTPNYFGSSILSGVYQYSQTPGNHSFYNSYLSAHRWDNEGMYQLLNWLSSNRR